MPITNCQECCDTAATFQLPTLNTLDLLATGYAEAQEIASFVQENSECGAYADPPYLINVCEELLFGNPPTASFFCATYNPGTGQIDALLVCEYDSNWGIEGAPYAPVRQTHLQFRMILYCTPTETDCICDCGCGCSET